MRTVYILMRDGGYGPQYYQGYGLWDTAWEGALCFPTKQDAQGYIDRRAGEDEVKVITVTGAVTKPDWVPEAGLNTYLVGIMSPSGDMIRWQD